jgi:H+/Cl- antiporter ClcA
MTVYAGRTEGMKNRQLFILMLVASAVCAVIGVYYLVPGVYHVLTFSGTPTDSHLTHALLFFGLALLGLIASRFVAGNKASRRS